MKRRSTKSHETTRRTNITKKYFGAVSCGLVDRSLVFFSKHSDQDHDPRMRCHFFMVLRYNVRREFFSSVFIDEWTSPKDYTATLMTRVARKFLIRGEVQGVGYRFFAQRAAARHQVTGYVRNCSDGTVEALVIPHAEPRSSTKHCSDCQVLEDAG